MECENNSRAFETSPATLFGLDGKANKQDCHTNGKLKKQTISTGQEISLFSACTRSFSKICPAVKIKEYKQ